ncbi:NUC189-domain-containing protein [Phlegmacium glaucopus]|nr:NUC189-domain-containing protein [Phlegmacium glaucopus]
MSKNSKSRPLTTFSQPTSGQTSILSSFSPDGTVFVIITLAIDKHRLRLYSTSSARIVAEHTFESSRVSALTWGSIKIDTEVFDTPKKKRKKRKTDSDTTQNEKQSAESVDVVVLGLEDGTIVFFSLTTSRIVHTLTHPSGASSVIALALKTADTPILWTSSTDGIVRLWDVQKHEILSSWHDEEHIPYTSLSLRPTSDSSQNDILVGHHHIRLFSDTTLHDPTQSTPTRLRSFTGHASSIMILRWAHAPKVSHRFFSAAVSDRFVYVWDAVEDSSLGEKPVACVALDSDVRTIGLSSSDLSPQTLVTLSISGKLSFIPIPESLAPPANTRETTSKMVSLLPRSAVASSSKIRPLDPIVIDVICVPGDSHSIRIARLIKGVKPVFEDVRYLDDDGNFIQDLSLEPIEEKNWDNAVQSVQTKRYAEPGPLGLASGLDIDQAESNDNAEMQAEIDGSLQVDLAELSLGQRLKAVSQKGLDLASDIDDDTSNKTQTKALKKQTEMPVVAANSLTRTLIQALHSSDTRLLEMCLTHSDPTLIRNTVRRLPPQLAIPLITSCVERLGRGNRATNMKGGGGGASSQRGSSLVAWVKTVLVIHAGHLMTIPDLVTRLSNLHATLTTRLSLHDSLLSLNGRLDMVLSQIELRSSAAPAALTSLAEKRDKSNKKSTVMRYVEGESDSSNEEDTTMIVETEHDGIDDIEEVELDGGSEDDGDNMSSESEDDGEGTVFNPFVDDEAEEEYSDEENEDDSE